MLESLSLSLSPFLVEADAGMSSDSLLRIACVGAGSIGREFAIRHISRCVNAEVVAIVDLDISAAQRLADTSRELSNLCEYFTDCLIVWQMM